MVSISSWDTLRLPRMVPALVLLALSLAIPRSLIADDATIESLTGGGASASASGLRLSGAIFGYGLPGDNAGRSTSSAHSLGVGFYPPLAALVARNAAEPTWLELAGMMRLPGQLHVRGSVFQDQHKLIVAMLDPDQPCRVP